MVADPQGHIDRLWLEAGDLAADPGHRGVVVDPGRPEQLVIALVAAEDRVGQVEEHDGRLGEVGESLILEPALGHDLAGGGRRHELVGHHRALRGDLVDERLAGEGRVADARPAVPRRTLPEALRGGVGILLRRIQAVRFGGPWRRCVRAAVVGVVRPDRGPVEGLGVRPEGLRAEAERLALVARQALARPARVRSAARVDRHDRDVLAELSERGDEAATREGDVVRVGGDEDVRHAGRVYRSSSPVRGRDVGPAPAV
ncbi:MAG: hypothetical protein A2V84_00500 [Chloroflexi bacterium RBG_16_70_13]|nr:MAG: hypothetical protein A2V84_00500 [Chloroflexi bacterium RBG_16_70_13]